MKSRQKLGMMLVAGAALLIAAAVIVGVVIRDGKEPPTANNGQMETVAPGPEQELNPGALVGNAQRSWPDPAGRMDDSAHVTPGEYSPDFFYSRPVWTPVKHDGDFPERGALVEGQCDGENALRGKTQQQYVNARYMVVNSEAGPIESVRGVPRGYAHSPQGAAVAAMNATTFRAGAGDEIAKETFEQLWSTSEKVKENRKVTRADDAERFHSRRYGTVPAPSGYSMVTCTDTLAVVDVAVLVIPEDLGGPTYSILRVSLKWTGDNWLPDFSGAADVQATQPNRADLDGFVEVTYE
nr:Uncharacterised protein [Streptococcus thermophilus]